MGIPQTEFEHLSLRVGTETDTHQFLFDGVALRNTHNHIVKQRTIQTVLCFMFLIFCVALHMQHVILYCNSKISAYFLGKLPFRSFYSDGIIRTYCYSNSLWYMNR